MEGTKSWTGRLGRALMAVVLAVGLMLPTAVLMARPGEALAATYQNKTVTIVTPTENGIVPNTDATYTGYYIFKANFVEEDNASTDKAQNIAWANDDIKTAVVNELTRWGNLTGNTAYTGGENAYQAAEYISRYLSGDSTNGNHTNPETASAGSLADALAKAVVAADSNNTLTKATSAPDNDGQVLTGAEGYWLVLTTLSTINSDSDGGVTTGDAGTAPMWVALGGSHATITAKTYKPTATLQVQEDDTNAYGYAADSAENQDLSFKAYGSMPRNLHAFTTYSDKYEITLPGGMSLKGNDTLVTSGDNQNIHVYITTIPDNLTSGAKDITSAVTSGITYSNKLLTVSIEDLKANTITAANDNTAVTYSDYVVIVYEAHLNGSALVGTTGNTTGLLRTYSSDPINRSSTTSTIGQSVRNYTYSFTGHKVDKSSGVTLGGAEFIIYDQTSRKYLLANGGESTITDEAAAKAQNSGCIFTSLNTGNIPVYRIDADVYTITEIKAPTKDSNGAGLSGTYELLDSPITLTMSGNGYRELPTVVGQNYTGFKATVSGGDLVNTGTYKLAVTDGSDYNATGTFNIQIPNGLLITMPLTGLPGYVGVVIAGVVLVLVGFGGIFLLRRGRAKRDSL